MLAAFGKWSQDDGEMAQVLRALTSLGKEPDLVSRTHAGKHTTAVTSALRFQMPPASASTCIHMHMHVYMCAHIIRFIETHLYKWNSFKNGVAQ